MDDKGFDPSTLVYWRKRLAKSDRPQRINEAVRRVVDETAVVRGRGKRAVDSTILAFFGREAEIVDAILGRFARSAAGWTPPWRLCWCIALWATA